MTEQRWATSHVGMALVRRGAGIGPFMVVLTAAGALAVAERVRAQGDALGSAPPRVVGTADAQARTAARAERLRTRYLRWRRERVPAATHEVVPVPPPEAQAPPPPDAPDGEITQQIEESAQ